jgi:hypothetical protein
MADKFVPGSQFQDWNSISSSSSALGDILQGAKSWALGQAIEKTGLKDWANKTFGKKDKEISPTGAVKPNYSVNADYGMPKMGGVGINPSYINQPNFGQFAVPSASPTAVSPTPQPAGPPPAPTLEDVDKTNDDLWGRKTSSYEPTADQLQTRNPGMDQMPIQMAQGPVAPPLPGYPEIPQDGGSGDAFKSILSLFAKA